MEDKYYTKKIYSAKEFLGTPRGIKTSKHYKEMPPPTCELLEKLSQPSFPVECRYSEVIQGSSTAMAAEYHTSVPLDSFRGTRETKRVTAAFIPTTLLTVEERRLVRRTNLHVAFADSAGLYTIDISIV